MIIPSLNKRRILATIFAFSILVHSANADVIFPLTLTLLPFYPLILFPEMAVLYAVKEIFGMNLELLEVASSVLLANIISGVLGLIVILPFRSGVAYMLTAWLYSTITEFPAYKLMLKMDSFKALKLSTLLNASSYLTIITFLHLRVGYF